VVGGGDEGGNRKVEHSSTHPREGVLKFGVGGCEALRRVKARLVWGGKDGKNNFPLVRVVGSRGAVMVSLQGQKCSRGAE